MLSFIANFYDKIIVFLACVGIVSNALLYIFEHGMFDANRNKL